MEGLRPSYLVLMLMLTCLPLQPKAYGDSPEPRQGSLSQSWPCGTPGPSHTSAHLLCRAGAQLQL